MRSEAPESAPASRLDTAALADLFTRCFGGYVIPLAMNETAMAAHIALNGIDLDASVLLVGEGGQPCGIGLLARRGERGWVGGVGVLPEFRGRGLGRRLMLNLLESARAHGLRRVQLEVLRPNPVAAALYRSLGFVAARELVTLDGPAPEPGARGRDLPIEAMPEPVGQPCWQREAASLRRTPDLAVLTVGGDALAYRAGADRIRLSACTAGDAATVRLLLGAVAARHPGLPCTIVNEPADSPLAAALRSIGWRDGFRQDEMILSPLDQAGFSGQTKAISGVPMATTSTESGRPRRQ